MIINYVVYLFSGKDASLSFITGDFTESGLTDDVSSLSHLQVVALYDWLAFYQKVYQSVGEWPLSIRLIKYDGIKWDKYCGGFDLFNFV